MAELSCISRLYCLTRNFAHLIKSKSSLKVSVRTFLIRISPPSALPPLLSRTVSCQSGWPRGLGALNSSPRSLISVLPSQWFPDFAPTYDPLLQRSEYLFTLRYVTLHFWDRRGAVLISYRVNRVEISVVMCERERREREWTISFSLGVNRSPIRYSFRRVFNSPIDDVPFKTGSGRPVVAAERP